MIRETNVSMNDIYKLVKDGWVVCNHKNEMVAIFPNHLEQFAIQMAIANRGCEVVSVADFLTQQTA